MPSNVQHGDYRSEIDGLRAIAVLGVVFYHAGLKCPGGYAGVDVFFVISGYLITSLLLRDLDSGHFSLVRFWERRCRRIMPALVVMVLATLIAGGLLLLPQDYAKLGRSALFQSLFASNIYFWQDTGYFTSDAWEKPLLHTWSLAVEEQFYLAMPLLLFLASCGGRRLVSLLLVSILAASLGWSAYRMGSDQASAFFLLPSRAWELLVGACLAAIPSSWGQRLGVFREPVSWLGVAGILFTYVTYSDETHFPGFAALPPVLGASLFIWSNQRTAGAPPPTWCGRVFSLRPLVFVGLISYSLYLWHWPVLAFINYWSFVSLGKVTKFFVILSSFLLAVLSWRFVETPFRRHLLSGQRSLLLAAGAAALVLLLTGLGIFHFNGLPWRVPPGLSHGYGRNSEASFMFTHQTMLDDLKEDKLVLLGKPAPAAEVQVVLWGDSHAMAAMPAFDQMLSEAGVSGAGIMHASTAPLLDFHATVPNGPKTDTVALNQAVFEWLVKHKVRDVVLAAYWHVYELKGKVAGVSATEYLSYYQQRIILTVKQLVGSGCQPWIMLQVPEHPYLVPKAHAYCTLFGADERLFSARPDAWNGVAGEGEGFLRAVREAGARIIDPRPAFLDKATGHYRFSLNGHALYGDKHHLVREGATKVLTPVLRVFLEPSIVK
ncbi:MAG: acyltransferase [Prosthecobacter sp.]|uniref:acyltransferase family protein n=1 Tax=Prosthecobacter sp. TaxID=1965333 RepID=UPI0019FA95DF|nr:acyltransferase family protein [Prosthecobacter sp.]MBE2286399.1 acyltransferase [Prosthecobacter sp.]